MKALIIIFGLLFGTQVLANDAGCGLGSLIFKSNGRLSQLLASTTNWSFTTQAMGITFGTSGCNPSGLVQNDKAIQYFVEVNREDLTRELAQGHGIKLTTLAALYGCDNDSTAGAFSATAQQKYGQILPSDKTTAVEMVQNLKTSNVTQMCHGT